MAAGLIGLCLMCGAAGAAETSDVPAVTITPVIVTKTQTLELGIDVVAPAFRSVNTVLRYDPDQIELINWSTELIRPVEIKVQVDSWSGIYDTAAARGSDSIASKPALTRKSTDGKNCYVSFGAESFGTVPVSGRVATLRFRLKDDAAGEKLLALTENEIGPSGTILSYASSMDAADLVRGRLECTVGQAEGAAVYADGWFSEDGSEIQTEHANQIHVNWTAPAAGESVIAASEFKALGVTFLDWDGSVLDTTVVPRGGDVTEQIQMLINDVNSGLHQALAAGDKPGYTFDCWLNWDKCRGDENAPFTSNNKPLSEHYQDSPELLQQYQVDFSDIGSSSANTAGTGITVQAAYYALKNVNEGGTWVSYAQSGGNYTIHPDLQFDRYGAATKKEGKYAIRVQTTRIQTDENNQLTNIGVERVRKPGVIVRMIPQDEALNSFWSYMTLENQEIIEFELVPTKEMAYVEFFVVESYGAANWPNSGARSKVVRVDMRDVIAQGTANYIFRQAILKLLTPEKSEWDVFVDKNAFEDMLYNEGGVFDLEEAKLKMLRDAYTYLTMAGIDVPADNIPDGVRARATTVNLLSEAENVALLAAPRAQSGWGGGFQIVVDGKTISFPSYTAMKTYLDELGGALAFEIDAYDPKKSISIELWRWDSTTETYGMVPAYTFSTPAWTADLEEGQANRSGNWSTIFTGNGRGTGVYHQRVVANGLEAGRYRIVLKRPDYLPIAITGVEIKLSSEAGSGDIPQELVKIYQTATGNPQESFYLPCGDFNGDGFIRFDDSSEQLAPGVLGVRVTEENGLARYDLDGDGFVTMDDYYILLSPENLGKGAITVTLTST